jgi:rubrerythrin
MLPKEKEDIMTADLEPPVGMSVWEHELFDHLVNHIRQEDELISDYERLAAETGGHVAYLLKLVMEDERRHHRLFEEWRHAPAGRTPDSAPRQDRTAR